MASGEVSRDGARSAGDVLVLNAGSSSLKGAVFREGESETASWRAHVSHLGRGEALLRIGSEASPQPVGRLNHRGALDLVLQRLEASGAAPALGAVGHRVVHSGPHFTGPVLLDREAVSQLHALDRYDPAHQAVEIGYIEDMAERRPGIPQVACFDTTFHQTLPDVARRLPVPRLDAARGVRRYGFHGLSYAHTLDELRRVDGEALASGRVVIAHLGSGASCAAVKGGRCVDTTMGLTPTGGFPMSSRSGDLDPGVMLWLQRHHRWSADEAFRFATERCGLLAIAETTADLSELLEREQEDRRAADAVEYFCHHVRKAIGALAAVLGGLDVLVFTGGVGEHQPVIRERICGGLAFLGVALEPARNAANAPTLSDAGAPAVVRVIRADEERVIAAQVRAVLNAHRPTR